MEQMEQPNTLEEAIKRIALADIYGFSDPFSAVQWRKTLLKEWQRAVEEAILEVYHATQKIRGSPHHEGQSHVVT